MATTSQPRQVSVAQVSKVLEETIVDFDRARAADLTEMNTVLTAKFTGLARDRVRLATKIGPTHPRVLALDGSLALHAATSPGFASEIAISSVTPPRVDPLSWALHGIVMDASRTPIQSVTVALYQKDTWVQRLGFACTDAKGYFVLEVQEAGKTESGPFSIDIVRNGKIIYIDNNPVTVQPGHVEFREIIIDATANTCPPPSGSNDVPPSPPASGTSTQPADSGPPSTTGGSHNP